MDPAILFVTFMPLMGGLAHLLISFFDGLHQCSINGRIFVNVFLIIDSCCFIDVSVFIHIASVYTGPEWVFLFNKPLKSEVE